MKSLAIVLAAMVLAGCTQFQAESPLYGSATGSNDRHAVWMEIRKSEEAAKADIAKAKAASMANATMTMTTMDSAGQPVTATMNLAPLLWVIQGDQHQPQTPMPKGVIAESIDSAGDLLGRVVSSPAAVAGVTAYGVVQGIKYAEENDTGDTVTTTTTTTSTGDTITSGDVTTSGDAVTSGDVTTMTSEEATTSTATETTTVVDSYNQDNSAVTITEAQDQQ